MLEEVIAVCLPQIICLLEIIGITVIVIGSVRTFVLYLKNIFEKSNYRIRIELGQSLALGLEFKMGAEILKTVLITEMNEILILGSIILLRAILSLLLHFEMKESYEE